MVTFTFEVCACIPIIYSSITISVNVLVLILIYIEFRSKYNNYFWNNQTISVKSAEKSLWHNEPYTIRYRRKGKNTSAPFGLLPYPCESPATHHGEYGRLTTALDDGHCQADSHPT